MAREAAPEGDDILTQAREAYERAREYWSDNHTEAKDDLAFARLGRQWDERIRRQRELEHRPCLTFNKMPAFIRQVVNDARQNKPAIKVHPQDSQADVRTAAIINGLIRNIETISDADVAYDTAIEHAVGRAQQGAFHPSPGPIAQDRRPVAGNSDSDWDLCRNFGNEVLEATRNRHCPTPDDGD